MDNSNRIATLIDKLKEQNANGVPTAYLLITTQMLLSELTNKSAHADALIGNAVVSNPFSTNATQQSVHLEESAINQELDLEKQTTQHSRFALPKLDLPEIPFLREHGNIKFSDTIPATKEVAEDIHEPVQVNPIIPEENTELHETFPITTVHDINEKLKENKVELASLLNTTPLADLRNAVGINDRFVFIQELFNADETMYERCIKTINAYTTYGEAASWIQRELKVKLGWKENSESVLHFDQLVKRRFS